jgi:hypothetical protein
MSKTKLGTKYDCYSCGTKFYDLGKAQAICPNCGADQQNPDALAEQELPRASKADRSKDDFVDQDDEGGPPIGLDDDDEFPGDLGEEEEIEDLDEE